MIGPKVLTNAKIYTKTANIIKVDDNEGEVYLISSPIKNTNKVIAKATKPVYNRNFRPNLSRRYTVNNETIIFSTFTNKGNYVDRLGIKPVAN